MASSWISSHFAALNLFDIAGSRHELLNIGICDAYLPHFRNDDGDNPTQHSRDFHDFILEMGVHHEDVIIKLFMMYLEGDTRKWYKRLPLGTISLS